jgi:hypothetical protein
MDMHVTYVYADKGRLGQKAVVYEKNVARFCQNPPPFVDKPPRLAECIFIHCASPT